MFFLLLLVAGSQVATPGCSSQDSKKTTVTEPPVTSQSPAPAPSPTQVTPIAEKASSLLLLQIDLREHQMADPSEERLAQMEEMGMETKPIDMQPAFLYFSHKPEAVILEEMSSLGIDINLDSWIPPSGNASYGFLQADVPLRSFDELVGKSYIIRLDTAERLSPPNEPFPRDREQLTNTNPG